MIKQGNYYKNLVNKDIITQAQNVFFPKNYIFSPL